VADSFRDGRPAARGGIFLLAVGHDLLMYIYKHCKMYISTRKGVMAVTMTSIRLDTDLADEAVKVLKAKSRTDAVHIALREIVALRRFKALMKKNSGKLRFSGLDE
jgi:Arc/MetJ family transcription regulator